MDSKFDEQMKRLANWLLFGLSGQDVLANAPRSFY
jgi:hypothetical protein